MVENLEIVPTMLLDLCMAACLKGRKDQNPVESFGQVVK
jgi:hypothetical protein